MIPVLQGKAVRLRGFAWADFRPFARMWQETEVARHIPFAPVAESQSWARFNANTYRWADHGFGNWAVCDHAGEFLGTTGFFHRAPTGDEPLEAGWVFASAAHGQGYASEAVALSHEWLDRQEFGGVSRCMMDMDHVASIRVAEKCGYVHLRDDTDVYGAVRIMERRPGLAGKTSRLRRPRSVLGELDGG